MSNTLWKSFYLCFSKFKCLPTALPPPPPSEIDYNINSASASASASATTTTIIKNFNSLYDLNSASTSKSLSSSAIATDDLFSSSYHESEEDTFPDFSTIYASQRFFCSSPGRSNSIFESPASPPPPPDTQLAGGGLAIRTYSPDPYLDFRRSMQEMVDAHEITDVKSDWEFLHELLLCYLTLNPKHTHKFIVRAFSDLLISLMSISPTDNDQKIDCHHHHTTQRLV